MLKVKFPKNVKLFYSILLPLANLEIIPPEISTYLIFDISSNEDLPFSPVLEEMGYETHNILLNMGSLYLYFFLMIIGLILMLLFKILRSIFLTKVFDKYYTKLK